MLDERRGSFLLEHKALEASLESDFLPATIAIRPHHFMSKDTWKALLGTEDPNEIARTRVGKYNFHNPGYAADLLGYDGEGRQSLQDGLAAYYTQLGSLSNESTILFDLKPDSMCAAACIGRHCSGTQYIGEMHAGQNTDYVELMITGQIIMLLLNAGFVIGKDYDRLRPAEHVLFDFRGENLSTPTVPRPTVVEFPALVARTGALRDAVRFELDPINRVLRNEF